MQKLFAQVATAALILSSYACSDVSNLRQSSSNTGSTPEVSTNLASAAKILSDSYCGTASEFTCGDASSVYLKNEFNKLGIGLIYKLSASE